MDFGVHGAAAIRATQSISNVQSGVLLPNASEGRAIDKSRAGDRASMTGKLASAARRRRFRLSLLRQARKLPRMPIQQNPPIRPNRSAWSQRPFTSALRG